MSERTGERIGVIEMPKISGQESVVVSLLKGRVNGSGLSNYPRFHTKKVLKWSTFRVARAAGRQGEP